jgi:hypothetical protein
MAIERNKESDLKKLANRVIEEIYFDNSCCYGAPTMDCKRPFGNSFGIERDILEIIGWDCVDEESNPSGYDEQIRYARELYTEEVVPYIQRRWKELT